MKNKYYKKLWICCFVLYIWSEYSQNLLGLQESRLDATRRPCWSTYWCTLFIINLGSLSEIWSADSKLWSTLRSDIDTVKVNTRYVTHIVRSLRFIYFALGKFTGYFSEVNSSGFVVLTRIRALCFSWDILSLVSKLWIFRQRKPCQDTILVS
jgi:hypothetical protein